MIITMMNKLNGYMKNIIENENGGIKEKKIELTAIWSVLQYLFVKKLKPYENRSE